MVCEKQIDAGYDGQHSLVGTPRQSHYGGRFYVGPGSVPFSRRTTAGCEKGCLQVVILRRYLFLNLDRFRQSCRSQQVLNINKNNTMQCTERYRARPNIKPSHHNDLSKR